VLVWLRQEVQEVPRRLSAAGPEVLDRDLTGRQDEAAADVAQISGWLLLEDIYKLYELSMVTPGPILEIGCHHGKSTVVIARALAARSAGVPFMSLDVDPQCLDTTAQNLAERRLAERVVLVRGSARACLRTISNLRPALVFLDGDHSYDGVRSDLEALESRVPNGALLLFHDYNDPGNADPERPDLGVVRAAAESWVAAQCDFEGTFGCCGLYRRRRGGPTALDDGPAATPIVDALLRDSLRLQYRQRIRWPAGRRLRALARQIVR
jgi:predicted O-methyltransferase YrrM